MYKEQHAIDIAVVDDHIVMRTGFERYLQGLHFVNKISSFATGEELFKHLRTNPVSLVLLDVKLKDEDGLELCKKVKEKYHRTAVIMVSAFDDLQYMLRAHQYGAEGYYLKDDNNLEKAVYEIAVMGRRYFSREVKKKLRNLTKNEVPLTVREKEIVTYICKGKSNKEIADKLRLAETTVAKHRQNLMQKIGAHKLADVYNYAFKHNLYEPY